MMVILLAISATTSVDLVIWILILLLTLPKVMVLGVTRQFTQVVVSKVIKNITSAIGSSLNSMYTGKLPRTPYTTILGILSCTLSLLNFTLKDGKTEKSCFWNLGVFDTFRDMIFVNVFKLELISIL